MSLCTPTSSGIVGIYSTTERICAKSFRCLGVCMAGRSTLVLGKYVNIIVYLLVDVRFPLCLPARCIEEISLLAPVS